MVKTELWTLNKMRGDSQIPVKIKLAIDNLEELPPIPAIAKHILELKDDLYGDIATLASIIELDPSIAAQVLKWVSSPLYGGRKYSRVKDAIFTIGYDSLLNLVFGLCILSPLKAPVEGKFGIRNYWIQFFSGQILLSQLGKQTTIDTKPLCMGYLLHNIGYLLMAHIFKKEFDLLTKEVKTDDSPVIAIERRLYGIDHEVIGAWLLSHWNIYEPIRSITLNHHNPYYEGESKELVWLVCLTNALLGLIDVGDSKDFVSIKLLCTKLNVNEESALNSVQELSKNLKQIEIKVKGIL